MLIGTTATVLMSLIGPGLIAFAVVLWFVIGWRRRRRRQARLERGFQRARGVERTGSGIQGTPYSLYGTSSWDDVSRHRR